MKKSELYARAYEEAQRLIEKSFSFYNPYTCIIESDGIPYEDKETFYNYVEQILKEKGEEIKRSERFFKIVKYNRPKSKFE